jgi:hypothetical protein
MLIPIEYYWECDTKENRELNDVDIDHISTLLKNGCVQGELCQYDNDTEEEVYGWWKIRR